jgi:L-ascorbate metabolism protein UlaG (beta-lactamase superfamily)
MDKNKILDLLVGIITGFLPTTWPQQWWMPLCGELLPIGAYEPRWFMSRMHMNPDEAVRAHLDLHSQTSIGIHFGLIDNAGESYNAPANDLITARRGHGVDATNFVAPHYGQVFQY